MSAPSAPTVEPASLGGLLRQAARTHPSTAVIFPNERCTVSELDGRADTMAVTLKHLGVQPGDKVGIWLPPGLDMLAALFGCARAAAIGVPISDRYRSEELRYLLGHAGPGVLLTTPDDGHLDRPGIITAALPSLSGQSGTPLDCPEAPALRSILVVGGPARAPFVGHQDAAPVATEPVTEPADEPGDVALLMYTSGTSSTPKGCLLSHRGLLAQAAALVDERYLLDSTCVVWSPLPLFHIAGIVTMLAALGAGSTYCHSGSFEPGQALRVLGEERVTHALAAFETIWMRLFDHPDYRRTDLSALRVALSANGVEQLQALAARLPERVALVANYGSTEACGHVSMGRVDEPAEVRMAAGGLPMPGTQVRILDPVTRAPVTPGTMGEIEFRGMSRFLGYYKDEQATAEHIDADGWFATGDLGVLDVGGRLRFQGRLKEMLKVGGENVAALEVEAFLTTHPAVNVAAVVGVPDSYYGEVPAAYLQLAPGSELTQEQVQQFCLGRIATFKVPRYVRIVDDWPMSGTKIRKNVLQDDLTTELAAAGKTAAPRLSAPRSKPAPT